jgi:hypothetical protein
LHRPMEAWTEETSVVCRHHKEAKYKGTYSFVFTTPQPGWYILHTFIAQTNEGAGNWHDYRWKQQATWPCMSSP